MRAAAFIYVLFFSLAAFAAELKVPGDYPTIQAAIDAAAKGDTVLVYPDTYYENIVIKGKDIIVKSKDGPEVTVIDGLQLDCVVKMQSNLTHAAVLEGFTITNGFASEGNPAGYRCGGGVQFNWQADATVTGNIIVKNTAHEYGAGIGGYDSSPLLTGNVVIENDSPHGYGGGIGFYSCVQPIVKFNLIENNTADDGGAGIYSFESGTRIVNNLVCDNEVWASGSGGGILCDDESSKNPVIAGNVIRGNVAMNGGGICLWSSLTHIVNNTIFGNVAVNMGGGIRCLTKFSANSYIRNTILWDNQAKSGPEMYVSDYGTLTITHSDVKGGKASVFVEPAATLVWGPGMLDADPLFVDVNELDFHLPWTSPCRDAGDGTAPDLPKLDFEADPRVAFGTVDMGADEFHTRLYYTGNATPGGYAYLNIIGAPYSSPLLLWVGSGVLTDPIPTKYGDWYLQFPLLLELNLGAVPPEGVSVNHFRFPWTFPFPWDIPLQSLVGPDLTNLLVMKVK